jgi:site-specific DNA-cytosine methylase
MHRRPTAVDLFCGGGGFSEGLRQAGFDVTHAVDIDNGAIETHELNHPETETVQADIMDLEPGDLPDDIDLLVGSPPCTEFSWAKSGGGGDIEAGMRLVKRFLHLVGELEPSYWVMENVPRLDSYLPDTIDFEDVPGSDRTDSIAITKAILDGDDHGTPQRRSRLFSGQLPIPEPSGGPVPTFGAMGAHFPRPTAAVPDGMVPDPTYDIEIPAAELSDHYYDSHVTVREAEEIRVRKEDHSFYGRMQFPDDPDDASRTVLATNRRVARETLVMAEATAPDGASRYRKPTIREIASIQGFPITYQFTGGSQARKWRRVGDAVPPTMAYRVGRAVREAMGHDTPEAPIVRTDTPHPEMDLNERDSGGTGRRRLSIARNLRHHVPADSKLAFRVDLETDKESQPPHPLDGAAAASLTHPVEFQVKLYRGYSDDLESTMVDMELAMELLDGLLEDRPADEPATRRTIERFLEELGPSIPDATTLQAIRSRRHARDEPIEYDLLAAISGYDGTGVVDRDFPQEGFGRDDTVPTPGLFGAGEDSLPVRVLLKLFGAVYLATKLDRCGDWMRRHPDDAHPPTGAEGAIDATEAVCTTADGRCIDRRISDRYLDDG